MPAWVPSAPDPSRRVRRPRRTGLPPCPTTVPDPAPAPGPRTLPGSAPAPGPTDDAERVRRAAAEAHARAAPGVEPPLEELVRAALLEPEAGEAESSRHRWLARPPWRRATPPDPRPPLPPRELAARARALTDELVGFGPLTPWVRRSGVTDVLVDAEGHVWTDGSEGLVRRPLALDPDQARDLAVRLIGQTGRRLDPAVPLADARVDGVRVHAVLPPVSGGGTLLSLRVPAPTMPSVADLAAGWPDGGRWEAAVDELVRNRATVLVSGATGSGKTTLLSAALSRAAPDERIVVVEDTREAAPDHPHVIPLQARTPNAEGAGEVTLAELIRQGLRMRPDRLVVGECRGAEVADLLTALNTGHQGAWGTLHANAADDVPARLTAMGALAGWSPGAVAAQVRAGVDAVLHVHRDARGRHPVELAVPDRPADPTSPLTVLPALTWDPDVGTREGQGLDLLRARLAGRAGRGRG